METKARACFSEEFSMPSCKGLAVPANMGWIRGPCVLQVAKMPQTRPSPLPACAWSKLVPCRDGLTRYYDQKAFGWGCREATINESDTWYGDFPLFLSLPSSCKRGGEKQGRSLLHEENSPR